MSLYSLSDLPGRLRLVALAEGVSYLLLFAVSMPLKYLFAMPGPNKIIGMIHGLLFVLYIFLVLQAAITYRWKAQKTILAVIASFLPFGAFWADRKLFREM